MSVTIKLTGALVCTSALMAVGAVQAQERAAASALETQMTWSTLSKLVETANANSTAANARVDQVSKCNLKYKLYAPEGKKKGLSVDGDGCIFNQPLLDLASRVEEVDTRVTETNKKLDDLEKYTRGEVARIDNAIAGLADTVAKLDTRVDKVEKGLDELGKRVKKVEDQIVVVNGKIATLTEAVADHEKRIDKAEATIKTHTTQINDINADIVRINKDIAALEKDVASLDTRVVNVETDVTRMLNCGKLNKLYNPTNKSCVSPMPDKSVYPDRIMCKDWSSSGFQLYQMIFIGDAKWEKYQGDSVFYQYGGEYKFAFNRKTGKQDYSSGKISNDCRGKSIQQLIADDKALWPGETTASKNIPLFRLP